MSKELSHFEGIGLQSYAEFKQDQIFASNWPKRLTYRKRFRQENAILDPIKRGLNILKNKDIPKIPSINPSPLYDVDLPKIHSAVSPRSPLLLQPLLKNHVPQTLETFNDEKLTIHTPRLPSLNNAGALSRSPRSPLPCHNDEDIPNLGGLNNNCDGSNGSIRLADRPHSPVEDIFDSREAQLNYNSASDSSRNITTETDTRMALLTRKISDLSTDVENNDENELHDESENSIVDPDNDLQHHLEIYKMNGLDYEAVNHKMSLLELEQQSTLAAICTSDNNQKLKNASYSCDSIPHCYPHPPSCSSPLKSQSNAHTPRPGSARYKCNGIRVVANEKDEQMLASDVVMGASKLLLDQLNSTTAIIFSDDKSHESPPSDIQNLIINNSVDKAKTALTSPLVNSPLISPDAESQSPVNRGVLAVSESMSDDYKLTNVSYILTKNNLPATSVTSTLPATSVTTTISATSVTNTLPATSVTNTLPATSHTNTLPATSHTNTLPATSLTNTLPATLVTNTLPATLVTNTLPATLVTNTLPATSHTNTLPATSLTNTLPATLVTNTLPATSVTNTLPATSVTDTLPATSVTNTLPATSVTKTLPATSHTNTLPATSHTNTLPATLVTNTLPATSHTNTLPATSLTNTLPATSLTKPLPATSVTSTLPAASVTSTLPAASVTSTLPAASVTSSVGLKSGLQGSVTLTPSHPAEHNRRASGLAMFSGILNGFSTGNGKNRQSNRDRLDSKNSSQNSLPENLGDESASSNVSAPVVASSVNSSAVAAHQPARRRNSINVLTDFMGSIAQSNKGLQQPDKPVPSQANADIDQGSGRGDHVLPLVSSMKNHVNNLHILTQASYDEDAAAHASHDNHISLNSLKSPYPPRDRGGVATTTLPLKSPAAAALIRPNSLIKGMWNFFENTANPDKTKRRKSVTFAEKPDVITPTPVYYYTAEELQEIENIRRNGNFNSQREWQWCNLNEIDDDEEEEEGEGDAKRTHGEVAIDNGSAVAEKKIPNPNLGDSMKNEQAESGKDKELDFIVEQEIDRRRDKVKEELQKREILKLWQQDRKSLTEGVRDHTLLRQNSGDILSTPFSSPSASSPRHLTPTVPPSLPTPLTVMEPSSSPPFIPSPPSEAETYVAVSTAISINAQPSVLKTTVNDTKLVLPASTTASAKTSTSATTSASTTATTSATTCLSTTATTSATTSASTTATTSATTCASTAVTASVTGMDAIKAPKTRPQSMWHKIHTAMKFVAVKKVESRKKVMFKDTPDIIPNKYNFDYSVIVIENEILNTGPLLGSTDCFDDDDDEVLESSLIKALRRKSKLTPAKVSAVEGPLSKEQKRESSDRNRIMNSTGNSSIQESDSHTSFGRSPVRIAAVPTHQSNTPNSGLQSAGGESAAVPIQTHYKYKEKWKQLAEVARAKGSQGGAEAQSLVSPIDHGYRRSATAPSYGSGSEGTSSATDLRKEYRYRAKWRHLYSKSITQKQRTGIANGDFTPRQQRSRTRSRSASMKSFQESVIGGVLDAVEEGDEGGDDKIMEKKRCSSSSPPSNVGGGGGGVNQSDSPLKRKSINAYSHDNTFLIVRSPAVHLRPQENTFEAAMKAARESVSTSSLPVLRQLQMSTSSSSEEPPNIFTRKRQMRRVLPRKHENLIDDARVHCLSTYRSGKAERRKLEERVRVLHSFGVDGIERGFVTSDYIDKDLIKITVSFRGTMDIWDMLTDIQFAPSALKESFNIEGHVHTGFLKRYLAHRDEVYDLVSKVGAQENVSPLTEVLIVFTGHSLGGALANLAALDYKHVLGFKNVFCVNFSAPKVFDKEGCDIYNKIMLHRSYRLIVYGDIIPKIMPNSWYVHVDKLVNYKPKKVKNKPQAFYAHMLTHYRRPTMVPPPRMSFRAVIDQVMRSRHSRLGSKRSKAKSRSRGAVAAAAPNMSRRTPRSSVNNNNEIGYARICL